MMVVRNTSRFLIILALSMGEVALPAGEVSEKGELPPGGVPENRGVRKNSRGEKRYDWMGVPFFNFRSEFGPGFGAKISLYDYGRDIEEPFKYNLQLQFFATSLGKKDNVLFFVAPKFLKTKIDFDVELRYQSLKNSLFFGLGNNAKYNRDYEIEESSEFKSSCYYEFRRIKPRFVLNVLREIGSGFRVLMGIGIQKTTIERHFTEGGPEPSLLFEENPFGIGAGYTNFLKAGLVYDTREFISSPGGGIWSEFAVEIASEALGSDYNYRRFTLTDRRYFTLLPGLVLAQRLIFEWMTGRPPFFEYSFIGGSATLVEAMGGDKSLRGYLQNRFIDKTKLITNTEFRYLLGTVHVRRESLDFYPVFFWDMGRVFPRPGEFTLKYLKFTTGGGFRVAWNRFFVARFDAGFSDEGYNVNIGFANIF